MPLTLLPPTEAADRLRNRLGDGLTPEETLYELIRAEVHARAQIQRALLIDRLTRLTRDALEIAPDRALDACKTLTREGDLNLAPGAILYATPLRAVEIPTTGTRLFSSLPTHTLSGALDATIQTRGPTRTIRRHEDLHAAIHNLKGILVPPERWAGLDLAPIADAAFLATLDDRLQWEPTPAGTLDHSAATQQGAPLDWRGLIPNDPAQSWRRDASTARLWRARTLYGHRTVWTSGARPSTQEFIELTSDEAERARLSLCRDANTSPKLIGEHLEHHILLEIPTWLPRPEYRWLSLHAAPFVTADRPLRWQIHASLSTKVTALLHERLGLTVEHR